MDRFKFRVWDIRRKLYITNGTIDIRNGIFATLGLEEAKKFIPEQCTGLKDKNGNLIYEGDILKSIFSDEKLYEVIWCADCYKLRVFTKSSRKTLEYLGLKNTKTSYEIIGNIHENPELLED